MRSTPGQLTGRDPAAAFRRRFSWTTAWSMAGPHGQPLAWMLGGKLALIGSNAGLTLILANVLTPELYGVLVAAIGLQLLVSRAMLAGVETGVMRFQTLDRARAVGRAGLMIIAAATTTISLGALGIALAWSWSEIPRSGLTVLIAGALGTALVDYGYHYLLANLEFRSAAAVQGGTALVRMLATGLAAILTGGHAMVTFITYAGVTLVSGALQAAAVVGKSTERPSRDLARRLLLYSVWLGVSNALVVLSLYEGMFLLLRMDHPVEAGIFGLALTLSLAFFALYNAFYEYAVARIVGVTSGDAARRFVVRSSVAALALCLACAPVIGLVGLVIPHLVGPEFSGVVTVFLLLAASMLVLVLQAPLEAASHALLRPHLVLVGWGIRVTAIALLVWYIAPAGTALDVALAQVAAGLVAAGVLLALVLKGMGQAGWTAACGRLI